MISNRSTGKTDQCHIDLLIAVMSVVQNTEHRLKTIFTKLIPYIQVTGSKGYFHFTLEFKRSLPTLQVETTLYSIALCHACISIILHKFKEF